MQNHITMTTACSLCIVSLCLMLSGTCAHLIMREKRSASGVRNPRVEKVNDNLYVAQGYALGNIIMIIAPEGLIIVDTTESMVPAKKIKDEFRKITNAPIKAIVYTHHHLDHIGGARIFVEDPQNPPDVWAHHLLERENEAYFTYAIRARFLRSMRQFGVFVNGSRNSLEYGKEDDTFGTVLPNKLVYEPQMNATVAGLPVTFVAIEGETVDQLGVWIPSMKAFMVGDTFYLSFPNTYTVRGAPVRSPFAWYQSVDRILSFDPDLVIPSHGPPFRGNQAIKDEMIPYRDGIQYMHDQAVRYINQGLKPDEVASRVKFPDSLKNMAALKEEYGMVEWSVKGVFQLYLGWFSGSAEDLLPLTYSERSDLIVDIAGGADKLLERAKRETDAGNAKQALELSSFALQADPTNQRAREVRAQSLNKLADVQVNSIAENYLRTAALETSGTVNLTSSVNAVSDTVDNLGIDYIFNLLPMAFKPEVCGGSNTTMNIYFCDLDRTFSIFVRNGVLVVLRDQPLSDPTFSFVTTENSFRNIIKNRNTLPESAKFLEISGNVQEIGIFERCFERL